MATPKVKKSPFTLGDVAKRNAGKNLKAELTAGSAKVRASRLRSKSHRTSEEESWLQNYNAKVNTARFSRPAAGPNPSPAAKVIDVGAAAQATPARVDNYAGATWVPLAPKLTDADKAQEPLVNAKIDEEAAAAAAAKVGGLLAFVTGAGLHAVCELAKLGRLPFGSDALVKEYLNDKAIAATLKHVAGCGTRIAMKHGMGGFAYEDEVTVAAALAGSALAVFVLHQSEADETTAPAAPKLAPRAVPKNDLATPEQVVSTTPAPANIRAKNPVLEHLFGGDREGR